jgi:hypothetical protein
VIRRLAVVLLVVSTGAVAHAGGRETYAGRPLKAALKELGARHTLNIVFSSLVVRPEMEVVTEPEARSPRALLDELLRPHGLRVVDGPRDSLLVVKALAAHPPRSSSARPSGRIKVGFRRLEDHTGLVASEVRVRGAGGDAIISADGSIVIPSVAAGIYTLEALVPGFASPGAENVAVPAGATVEVVIDLAGLPDAPLPEDRGLPTLTLVLTEGARFRETVRVSAGPEAEALGVTVTRGER